MEPKMIKKITASLLFTLIMPLSNTVTADELVLTEQWQSKAELKQPESVAYDIMRRSLYVSNINGEPSAKDGNGFISLIANDGKIEKLKWVDGLNAPKGMAIFGKNLFVADINELLVIDVETAKITKRFTLDGEHFLNDVAIDRSGIIYVTDTSTNRIYRLYRGQLEIWLEDKKLDNPNGLYIDNEHLIVGSWGKPTDGWKTDIPGHLLVISSKDKSIADFADGSPIGNLDGLAKQDDTTFLVTDWMQGKLMQVSNDGQVNTLLDLGQGTADILYLRSKKLLLIPHMMKGKLIAYSIK
jgi:sugar lactone lactonase YvrE